MNRTEPYEVVFPDDYDAYSEYEHKCKGYLPDVTVRLADGTQYTMFFIDIIRLQQELENNIRLGMNFVAEGNMVVLPEISTEQIKSAVATLVQQDFFSELGPKRG